MGMVITGIDTAVGPHWLNQELQHNNIKTFEYKRHLQYCFYKIHLKLQFSVWKIFGKI